MNVYWPVCRSGSSELVLGLAIKSQHLIIIHIIIATALNDKIAIVMCSNIGPLTCPKTEKAMHPSCQGGANDCEDVSISR